MKLRRIPRVMLYTAYYYIKLMGLLHFNYDFKGGRVIMSRSTIIYAALTNIFLLGQLAFVYNSNTKDALQQHVNDLHMFVFVAMGVARISAVVITVAVNWRRRSELLSIIADFQNLRRGYFARFLIRDALQRRFEKFIICKFLSVLFGDLSILGVLMDMLYRLLNVKLYLSMSVLTTLSDLLNVVMNLYYFAMLFVILHFHVLNEELQRILLHVRALATLKRRRRCPGICITLCCQLADELDELALAHCKLQHITQRINAMFQMQAVLFMLNIHFNNIGICYHTYTIMKHQAVSDFSAMGTVFQLIWLVSYYFDVALMTNTQMEMLHVANAAAVLLQQKWPTTLLDVRLECSLEHFALQLSRNPLELWLLGLFKFNRELVFANFASTVSHTLVLIQYDYKHY